MSSQPKAAMPADSDMTIKASPEASPALSSSDSSTTTPAANSNKAQGNNNTATSPSAVAPPPPKKAAPPLKQSPPLTPYKPDGKWYFSPAKGLKLHNCDCLETPKHPDPKKPPGHQAFEIQHARFTKVWQRLTKSKTFPSAIQYATFRTLFALKSAGFETFHVVAKEVIPTGMTNRSEISMLVLIPSNDPDIGHRWVAEILIHRYISGRKIGKIEHAAVRFATDYEDWTIVLDHQYFTLDIETVHGNEELKDDDGIYQVDIPRSGNMGGKEVVEQVWRYVAGYLGGENDGTKKELLRYISRATAEINVQEKTPVSSFQVARRFRKSTSGRSMVPCIQVSLMIDQKKDQSKEEEKEEEKDDGGSLKTAAIIMIDPVGEQGLVKPLAVIFEHERPIAHQYRKKFPPPDLKELQGYVKDGKSKVKVDADKEVAVA